MNKPHQVTAALPNMEPQDYDSAATAVTALQAELIGQGKDPHGDIIVGIHIGGGKIALVRMPLDKAKELDRLMRGREYE